MVASIKCGHFFGRSCLKQIISAGGKTTGKVGVVWCGVLCGSALLDCPRPLIWFYRAPSARCVGSASATGTSET